MNTRQLVEHYLRIYTGETKNLAQLTSSLETDEDIWSRKNFNGHITASGFVINKSSKQVLLLDHKALERWLQPGGHINSANETPRQAAVREIHEGAGIKPERMMLRPIIPQYPDVPFDIDTHTIPTSIKRSEPEHYHHDFRYLFVTDDSNIKISPDESHDFSWVDWKIFSDDHHYKHIADKIDAVLKPNVQDYFTSLTTAKSQSISVLVVAHIIPSSEEYLTNLCHNFNFIGVIPKPKSINKSSLLKLTQANIPVFHNFTREAINDRPEKLVEMLRPHERTCLVDIGGYFSGVTEYLKNELGDKLVGIIEDTENGLQKYEKTGGSPMLASVARSPLKNFEDQLVGQSIAHATETIIRQDNALITYMECGVIGYGKIGRGVCEYLKQRGVQPWVTETNALRAVQASCDGAKICDIQTLLKTCDVVICATGAQAMNLTQFRDLKNNAYVASATSSEDEFDLSDIEIEYEKQATEHGILRYAKRGHTFHLLNDGNAVNFVFSGSVDSYITLVQGELIYSICKLFDGGFTKTTQAIKTNDLSEHEHIAQAWLDYIQRDINITTKG